MGVFDKVKGAFSGLRPDHAAILSEQLGDERYLAHAVVVVSASESEGSRASSRGLTGLAQDAAHRATDAFVENRHIGGDEGSIARSLPRDFDPAVLALAEDSVTLWKFGLGAKKTAPDLLVRIPREQVASVADTGKRKARGHIRLSFTDDSFFDYQTLTAPGDEFWTVAEAYGIA